MNNSFYIYSSQKVVIERLHLCTWDVRGGKARFELGIEILNDGDYKFHSPLKISVHLPFTIREKKIISLHKSLCDEKISRYIFNDIISSSDIIDEDPMRGKILHFKERGNLAIIPAKIIKFSTNEVTFEINPNAIKYNLYLRVLMELDSNTIAIEKSGIAKKNYIFDFKINERRNMPENLVTRIKSSDLLEVNQVFLFHVVPYSYNIDFYDSNKFQSIRKIEKDVFAEYTSIKELTETDHIILFNKDTGKASYSFYTCFSREILGTKQIVFAIGANILCSLLFAIPGLRLNWNSKNVWYVQFPWEWCLALMVLVSFIVYVYKKKD